MKVCFMGEKETDSSVGEKVLRIQKGDTEADSDVIICWILRMSDLLHVSA